MSAKSKKSSEAIDRPFDPQISNKAREIVQHYQVILSNEEGHWYGRGLELPHVFGDGASVDQCVADTREALVGVVAYLIEQGQRPPAPAQAGTRSEQVNVRLTAEEKLLLEAAARLNAQIQSNGIASNNGDISVGASGIYGDIQGNSNLQATLANNTVDGTGVINFGRDDGVKFDINVTDPTLSFNRIDLSGNRIIGHNNEGMEFNVRGNTSRVDVAGTANTISSNIGNGVLLNTFDNSATRLTMIGANSINNNSGSGVLVNTNNTSRAVATVTGNVIKTITSKAFEPTRWTTRASWWT
jgi:predicted RNase H-like HicB family nuclease